MGEPSDNDLEAAYRRGNRQFEEIVHATPLDYLHELCMRLAYSVLLGTALTLEDVRLEAGYESTSSFDHAFKARWKESPSAVRARRKGTSEGANGRTDE